MSAQVKSYILAPTWDYPPDGPLRLGSIIISPSQPVPALALISTSTEQPPASTTSASSSGEVPSAGFRSTKHNVSWSCTKQHSGQFGVWSSFLQLIGIDVGLEMSRGSSDIFEFDQMITEEHYPSDEDLRRAITSSPRAVQHLRPHGLRRAKGLYVIVGVKTVIGARVKRQKTRETGIEGKVSADGLAEAAATAAGLPVSFGPSIGLSKSESDEASFQESDDFVFAFRVKRIKLRGGGGEVQQEDYKRGALYSHRLCEDDAVNQDSPEVSVMGLEEEDFSRVDMAMGTVEGVLDDDGEEVVVVRPKGVRYRGSGEE